MIKRKKPDFSAPAEFTQTDMERLEQALKASSVLTSDLKAIAVSGHPILAPFGVKLMAVASELEGQIRKIEQASQRKRAQQALGG